MRRAIALLPVLVVAVWAAGCTAVGSSGGAASSTGTSDLTPVSEEPEPAVTPAGTAGRENDPIPVGETPTPKPTTTTSLPAGPGPECGFGSESDPEPVDIVQIDGGERESTASAFNGPHPDFPDPLIDPADIISGGPPPDGIPPIDTPRFQTATSVDWLACTEPVLSLVVDGDARAYPIQIMTWHEIVNDTFGDVPVTVAFCPLCNSALVYRRDVGDRVLDFGTSGKLYNSSLVMWDRQTESYWTHFDGQAIVGALTGTELERLPVQMMAWQDFLRTSPDGIVLTRQTGHDRAYGRNPYGGYDTTDTQPFLFFGEIDERLAAKERVVSIEVGADSVAVVLEDLAADGVQAITVGDLALSVWHLPGASSALDTDLIASGRDVGTVGVFVPEVDGRNLTFTPDGMGAFTDAETGSTWDIDGTAIAGDLSGSSLTAVEHVDTFWFAIAAFRPDTSVIGR